MKYNFTRFPKQRLSYAEKSKNDFQWAKDTIDFIMSYSNKDMPGRVGTDEYNRILRNYRWYNLDIDEKEFEYECNIFGIDVGQVRENILPFTKIPNKVNTLLGEERNRPFNFRTVLINPESVNMKLKKKHQMLQQYFDLELRKMFYEILGTEDPDPQDASKIMTPEEVERYFRIDYRDIREHYADNILQYLIKEDRLKEKKNDAFAHGLKSGYEIVKVGVKNGFPTVEVINPLSAFWYKSPEVKYIQKALFAGHTQYKTVGEVLDEYSEDLTKEEIERIEGKYYAGGELSDKLEIPRSNLDKILQSVNFAEVGSYSKPDIQNSVSVTHVEWRSQKKIGFLKYLDSNGELASTLVDESFEIPDNAVKHKRDSTTVYEFDGMILTWGWIPEIWEATVIDGDIYTRIGPRKYQYRSVENPYDLDLSYHGVIYSNMNSDPVSVIDRMIPFDKLFIITANKLKNLIAKDRGQVFHFDLSMVNPKIGLEKTIYYLNELDIDFYDPLQNAHMPGAYQRGKITGATSRSNMQHIGAYVQLLAALDQQISDIAGISRQREGWIDSGEAVGNSKESILRSAVVTEAIYFFPHEQLWESVLNSLIQCAQLAFKDKRVLKQFVLDDLSVASIHLDPLEFANSDFGLYITDSAKDDELFKNLKYLSQSLIQNDKIGASEIIAIMEATSKEDLKRAILEGERKRAMEVSQQLQAQMQLQEKEMQFKAMLQDAINKTKLAVEQSRAETVLKEQEMESNTDLEIAKLRDSNKDNK